jgi:hypothetical protein
MNALVLDQIDSKGNSSCIRVRHTAHVLRIALYTQAWLLGTKTCCFHLIRLIVNHYGQINPITNIKIDSLIAVISLSSTGSTESGIDSILCSAEEKEIYLELKWLKINHYHSTWSLFVRSHLDMLASVLSGSFWKTKPMVVAFLGAWLLKENKLVLM